MREEYLQYITPTMSSRLYPALEWLADLMFPIRCIVCGVFAHAGKPEYVCRGCLNTIAATHPLECIGCNTPSRNGDTCPACSRNGWYVDRLVIATDYEHAAVQKILHAYKYQFVRDLHRPLSHILLKALGALAKNKNLHVNQWNPVVVSTPLSPYRLRWRGFDHIALLASAVADAHLLPYEPNVLARPNWQRPQTDMAERDERLTNVAGSFRCLRPGRIRNAPVLLIDDVCTTGATLNECARVLKQNGARSVSALVIARG